MLRTIFWVITAVVIVLFAMWNWAPVSVKIWPEIGTAQGLRLDTFLPMLILGAYALGAVPVWLVYRATRWNLTRRVENAERQLADLRQQNALAQSTTPAVSTNDSLASDPLPTTVTPNTPSL